MAPLIDLISCNIIEKDCNGDVLWVWTYPSVSDDQKSLVTRKCGLSSENVNSPSFTFSRFNNDWFYINCSEVFDTDKLPKVKYFALVLFTKDFNPQKYEVLSRILSKTYCKSGDPVEVLKLYLSVFIDGTCTTQENGIFSADHYNETSNGDTKIRDLIKTFELETILIYTALLLKKRIFIYHHSLEQLFTWIKTFPFLMKHRKVTEHLFPWVDLIPEEINDLKEKKFYVAGCRDSSISLKPELYDLLVNIPAREITIAPHAKESFTMTKTHKEIALFMIQLSEKNTLSETQIIQEINDKTQDLVNQLKTIAGIEDKDKKDDEDETSANNKKDEKKVLLTQTIRDRNLTPAVENFLINLAVAEDYTIS